MIRLLIDNQYPVYLDKGTRLRLEFQMPYFSTDGIPVPVIYPFNIPIKKNESVFSYAHFTLLSSKTVVFDVTMYFDNVPVLRGKFYIKTITAEHYRGSIIFNGFSDEFKTRKLSDLVYEDITIGGTPHSPTNVAYHAEQIVKGFAEADYTFPVIFAENFYGEPDDDDVTEYNPDWGGDEGSGPIGRYINNYNAAAGMFPINSIHEDPLCDNVASMVPCPYIHPLLRKIFDDEGFNCFGAFFDDTELQDLIIFYNYPLDEKYKKYFVRASWDDNQSIGMGGAVLWFPDESTGDNEDEDGCWNNSTYRYTIKNRGYHSFSINVNVKPHTYTENIIARIRLKNEAGDTLDYQEFTVVPETWTELDYELLYYFDEVLVNSTVYLWFEFVKPLGNDHDGDVENQILIAANISYQNLNQFSNKMNIANHLPPVEVNEFINSLKNGFGLGIFFDFYQKEAQLSLVRDIFSMKKYLDLSHKVLSSDKESEITENGGYKFNIDFDRDVYTYENYEYIGEFDTFNDLPTPSEPYKIALERSSNSILIYKKDPDSNIFDWFYWSDNIYPVEVGDGEEEITAGFSTLAMHIGNDLLTAQTKTVAGSPAFETGDNDFPLTLLFDRGMQENANGDEYPMASCVSSNLAGAGIGDYHLKMNGDNGLYAKFLEKWYLFLLESEEIKRYFHCTVIDFINIVSLFMPQRGDECRKIMVDNMIAIPKKVTFILTPEGIEQTEIIMIKSNANTDGR
jgi:hypothetical protein